MTARLQKAYLANPDEKLPMPGGSGRFFSAEGETVDSWDPFWKMCLKDGSLTLTPPATLAPHLTGATASASATAASGASAQK
jgi:uncharacterized membrane protein